MVGKIGVGLQPSEMLIHHQRIVRGYEEKVLQLTTTLEALEAQLAAMRSRLARVTSDGNPGGAACMQREFAVLREATILRETAAQREAKAQREAEALREAEAKREAALRSMEEARRQAAALFAAAERLEQEQQQPADLPAVGEQQQPLHARPAAGEQQQPLHACPAAGEQQQPMHVRAAVGEQQPEVGVEASTPVGTPMQLEPCGCWGRDGKSINGQVADMYHRMRAGVVCLPLQLSPCLCSGMSFIKKKSLQTQIVWIGFVSGGSDDEGMSDSMSGGPEVTSPPSKQPRTGDQ